MRCSMLVGSIDAICEEYNPKPQHSTNLLTQEIANEIAFCKVVHPFATNMSSIPIPFLLLDSENILKRDFYMF